MPSFSVSHKSRLAPFEAFERVSELVRDEPQFRKLDPDYECQFDAAKLSGTAQSQYFSADMNIDELDQGCEVSMTVQLPAKYTLAKGLIKKALQKKMRSEL